MKTKLIKSYNIAITALLAILGFSACLGTSCAKYGSPAATFIIHGKVSDKETQQPIENIRVAANEWRHTFTDENGNYEVWHYDRNMLVQFRDTVYNYNDLDTFIKFEGKEKMKIIDIQLTPKKHEN
jgi:putative lipoprotein (rSAM/lipoprotein system)